jgi:hypothetical protein
MYLHLHCYVLEPPVSDVLIVPVYSLCDLETVRTTSS